MESNLQRRVAGLDEKLPDIQKTLDTVQFLQIRRKKSGPEESGSNAGSDAGSDLDSEEDDDAAIETIFELNDTLYAKAAVPPTDEVYLWLGVCVPAPYPLRTHSVPSPSWCSSRN